MAGIQQFGTDETSQAAGNAPTIHGADLDTSLVQVYYSAASDPTVNNDGVDTAALGELFFKGSIWVNETSGDRWQCDDITTGAAVWSPMGGGASGIIAETQQTISEDYTLTAGMNGHSVGPVTIATGFAVTVPTGARWLVS